MASEVRVNQIQNRSGLGTVTFSDSGVSIAGVTTVGILSATGNSVFSGSVTATTFSGALTGNATGLSGTPNITVGSIIASSATISGNVSVAGTLTYEDVTNVDSVGLVTARTGVRIDAGGLVVVGVTTVAAGSTAAPSITPTGDSNTGIFFPSADTIAFGEGGSEALRIDSSGRVTIPNQPAFHVQKGYGTMSSFMGSSETSAIATWNSILLNTGSYFNSGTGRFTAPVAGVYTFSFVIAWSGTGDTADFLFYKNGNAASETVVIKYNATTGGLWVNAANTLHISLAVNDYVTVGTAFYSGNAGNARATFCGHLIG